MFLRACVLFFAAKAVCDGAATGKGIAFDLDDDLLRRHIAVNPLVDFFGGSFFPSRCEATIRGDMFELERPVGQEDQQLAKITAEGIATDERDLVYVGPRRERRLVLSLALDAVRMERHGAVDGQADFE